MLNVANKTIKLLFSETTIKILLFLFILYMLCKIGENYREVVSVDQFDTEEDKKEIMNKIKKIVDEFNKPIK